MDETRAFVFQGVTNRLDRFLAGALAPLSRTQVQRLIAEGRVSVNGTPAPSRHLLAPGDAVEAQLPPFSSLPDAAADSVPILFEDAHLIVVNKPAGWVVHPAGPHRHDTLVQRLWPKLQDGWGAKKSNDSRPGVVHRLDRGTTGVLVIAKTPQAADAISRQFAARTVEKIYWAVVEGLPRENTGRVTSSVGRSRQEPHRMSTGVPGRLSETNFQVLARFPDVGPRGVSLLEVRPKTGRTHQIRVQMAALGHPLVGDKTYDAEVPGDRPLLHALSLTFDHPATGKRTPHTAPPPADFGPFLPPPPRA